MRILYFLSCITLSFITSAWPHPGDLLETVSDLRSVFDIFSWPATVEDAIASAEPAECPVDSIAGTAAGSNTLESDQLGVGDNYLLDPNLFSGLQTVTESRAEAPPCGPDGTHHLVCCLEEYGAPGFLMDCRGGTYNRNFSE